MTLFSFIYKKKYKQFMIFIGLDVSKISTALCIEKNNEFKLFSYTTKKDNNIWIKNTSEFINYRHINYSYKDEKDYSISELLKLREFDKNTDLIIKDITDNINSDDVKIGIEGYSYSSTGPIFDLIEFTSYLKFKLLKLNYYNNIEILSPLSVKIETCKKVYKPRIELKGKKIIKEILHYENNNGKQATKFDKWDMLFAFIDSDIDINFKNWCISYREDITKGKEVPKPLDDIIDSIWISQIIKSKNINI